MDYFRRVDKAKHSEGVPEFPAQVLASHCTMKGVQAGSVLGTFLLTPLYAYQRQVPLPLAWRLCSFPASLLGGAAGLALLLGKEAAGQLTVEGVDERALRLAQNQAQRRLDALTVWGAAAGATAGALRGGVLTALPGASSGAALAVAYFALERGGVGGRLREALGRGGGGAGGVGGKGEEEGGK